MKMLKNQEKTWFSWKFH